MSEAVNQFLMLVKIKFAEIEAEKMAEQGRAYCDHCKGFTFSRSDGRCSICHNSRGFLFSKGEK